MRIVSVDVEAVNGGESWMAIAIVVYDCDTNRVTQRLECYRVPDEREWTVKARQFWARNPSAYKLICERSAGMPDAVTQQMNLCRFVNNLKTGRTDDIVLVGDNPTFDYGVVNSILRLHGHSSIQNFPKYKFVFDVNTAGKIVHVKRPQRSDMHTPFEDAVYVARYAKRILDVLPK